MLREVRNTRQVPGEPFRRWFADSVMDLIVWFAGDRVSVIGFQLCYGKGEDEKALTWHRDKGCVHGAVDDGEGRPGRYKMSPVLMPDGILHAENVRRMFIERSGHMDGKIVEFVSGKIGGCREP